MRSFRGLYKTCRVCAQDGFDLLAQRGVNRQLADILQIDLQREPITRAPADVGLPLPRDEDRSPACAMFAQLRIGDRLGDKAKAKRGGDSQ